MNAEQTESEVLQRLLPELQAEGYEVYIKPSRPLLPEFLQGYSPDAIAKRSDRNVAIEVMRQSPDSEKRAERLADLFKGRTDWELRLIWVSPVSEGKSLQIQTTSAIRKHIKEVKDLLDSDHNGPALLLAWATFEAAGRLVLSKRFEKPQTPGRLIQVLASDGVLTPTEADDLRPLADKRNKFIHGELQTPITKAEVERIAAILGSMIDLPKKGE